MCFLTMLTMILSTELFVAIGIKYPGPRGFLLILSFLFGKLQREALRANKKIKEATVRVAKFANKE